MGNIIFDQYSLLHFSVGILLYFWGINGLNAFLLHTAFELLENTQLGMNFINSTFKGIWPGGKNFSDTNSNKIGDTISFMVGWFLANKLDEMGVKYKWFTGHLH